MEIIKNLLSRPLGAEPNPGMIMTKAGNLKCKRILHLAVQLNAINKNVKEALQMCVKTYTSISFPAIGTGEIPGHNSGYYGKYKDRVQ